MEIVLCSFEFVIRINEKTSRKDKKSLTDNSFKADSLSV